MHNTLTVKGIFQETYALMKPKFWQIILRYAVVIMVFGTIDYLTRNYLLLSIISSTVFSFVTTIMSLAYVREGVFSLRRTLHGMTWKLFAFFAGSYLLAKLIIIGGTILFIVPGIIAVLQLFMMKYLALEEDIQPIAALKKSVKLTRGHRIKILEIVFFMILLNILGLLCLIVGIFITAPFMYIGLALMYKKLVDGHEEEGLKGEDSDTEEAAVLA